MEQTELTWTDQTNPAWIIYSTKEGKEKGAIVKASSFDEARRKAFHEIYDPWTCFLINDLDTGQPYNKDCRLKNTKFKKLQFNWPGGRVTKRNAYISEQPSEKQRQFMGNGKIESIVFFNADNVLKTGTEKKK